ncbi:hypothetical protein EV421DRAFT_1759434, partial [Armillaria borealis]
MAQYVANYLLIGPAFIEVFPELFDRWLHVKMRFDSRVEVASMLFIATNISVPVPKIYLQFRWRDLHYVIMKRAPGQCLAEIWPDLPYEAKLINSPNASAKSAPFPLPRALRFVRCSVDPFGTSACTTTGTQVHSVTRHTLICSFVVRTRLKIA